MGRPPKWQQELTRIAQQIADMQELPNWRLCPFTADWHHSKRIACDECVDGHCARFVEIGLNDEGLPLPEQERPHCNAKMRDGGSCQARVVPGKLRCRIHGGMSTGPKSTKGRRRIAEAQRARWAIWRVGQ